MSLSSQIVGFLRLVLVYFMCLCAWSDLLDKCKCVIVAEEITWTAYQRQLLFLSVLCKTPPPLNKKTAFGFFCVNSLETNEIVSQRYESVLSLCKNNF